MTDLPTSVPDRAPPHSAEAEEHVIACCLLDAGIDEKTKEPVCPTLTRALDTGLTPNSFYSPANRLLFEVIAEIHASRRPPTLETLAEELKTRRQLESVGGFAYLMQVTAKIPTTAHAGYFIEKVREKAVLRDAIRAHTQAVEEAYSFTGGLDEFLQIAKARVEAIGAGVAQAKRHERMASLLSRRVSLAHPQPEPKTRLYLADKPISTPGNITTLISRAKTGKTATLGAATAAIITASLGTQSLGYDTFKFRANNPDGQAVLVIDTEQSLYDAYLCYQRSLSRANTDTDPAWLHHYSLVGYGPQQAKDALTLAAESAVAAHKGIFAIILDGVADLVASVNDEAECNGLVTWLRALATAYDCPIICVIHSNEAEKAGDDGRGHLGKQLIRKAESNLLLRKSGDVTTVTSDKQRKAPITKADGVSFRWDDEKGMHASCDPDEAPSPAGRKRVCSLEDFMEIFPMPGEKPTTGAALHRMAQQIADVKPTTFKDMLLEATRDGILSRSFDPKTGYSYVRTI